MHMPAFSAQERLSYDQLFLALRFVLKRAKRHEETAAPHRDMGRRGSAGTGIRRMKYVDATAIILKQHGIDPYHVLR